MELKAWETIQGSREVLHENPWFSLYREKYILPSGKEGTYHVVHSEPSAIIIPRLPDGRFRMIRQFRYVQKAEGLEFPCGNARHGDVVDTIEVAAARELAEEAHLEGALTFLGKFFPWNGVSSQECHVFLAKDCKEKILAADETEEIIFIDLAEEEVDQRIRNGEVTDGESLAGWMLYKNTYANL